MTRREIPDSKGLDRNSRELGSSHPLAALARCADPAPRKLRPTPYYPGFRDWTRKQVARKLASSHLAQLLRVRRRIPDRKGLDHTSPWSGLRPSRDFVIAVTPKKHGFCQLRDKSAAFLAHPRCQNREKGGVSPPLSNPPARFWPR